VSVIVAPQDARPDPATTYPERYAVVRLHRGTGRRGMAWHTLVWHCRNGRQSWKVGRTYLRDAQGIHADWRAEPAAIAETRDELVRIYGQHLGEWVAVPASVAGELVGGELEFAADAFHPTLGVAILP
jgi:hypothetical protein